jgi:hypothetical protein
VQETPSSGNIVSAEPETPANANEHRSKEEAYWKQQVFWSRWTAISAALAFLAAAIYAYFACQQVTAMNNAVVEQTKATRAAQQAAAAAASEARTARDALTLTVNTEVEADGIACTDIQDLGPTFRLKVSNRGSRRATDVHVTWGYEIGGAQPQATVADFCKHSENLIAPILEAGASLPPVEMTGLWGCIKDPASAEFKTAVIHEIEHGGRTFNVIGHVDFIDIIGMPQTKPFEYSYQPNYSLPDDKRVWTCNFIPQFRPRPASSAGHHP